MTTACRILNPLAQAQWDDQLAAAGNHGFFHTSSWARVLADTYGFRPCYYTLGDGQDMAILALMDVRSALTGRRAVSLPFTDAAPIFSRTPETARELLSRALADGPANGWRYIELRGGEPLVEGMTPSLSYWTHDVDLAGRSEQQLFDALDESMGRGVRKASKAGLRVQVDSEPGSIEHFYHLNCITRREHGLPPQPLAFFRNVQRHVLSTGRGRVVLAFEGAQAVAGAVLFHFGERAVFKYGASSARGQDLRGNNLVMWEAIRWSAIQGFRELQLGRTNLEHEGLRRFKLNLGSREALLHYYKYDFCGATFVQDKDKLTGWHNRVFRMLPIPVGRAVGAVMYRHVA